MSGQKKKGRRKPKVRMPLPRKAGYPIGTQKGRRGYDRKREREEIERDKDAD